MLRARRLASLLLLLASPTRANVTGHLELQSQTSHSLYPGGADSTSTVLSESLSLHYAGLPFGPSVAIATLGGSFANVSAWQPRVPDYGARVLSFDASMGFLPRRAVPLRLYGHGTMDAGTNGLLATPGAGPSVLYGATMNLEPGTLVPGLRLDASEARSSRPGLSRFSDVQRRVVGSSYGTLRGQRLVLGVKLEDDDREGAGRITSLAATLNASSPRHQSAALASDVRRSLPTLAGITSDRLVSATSDQRWSPALSTQLGARYSEAGAGLASGTLGDARAGVTWLALRSRHQLSLSTAANAGFTRTSSPGAESSGTSYGGGARAAYGRPLGPVNGTVGVGAALSGCDCGFGIGGTTTQVDGTVSAALLPNTRGTAQADFTLVRALAPLQRGGDRVEGHARGFGRLSLGLASALDASLSYDDGVRELLDITSGRATSVHERAVAGSLGASTQHGRVALAAQARHARGSVVGEGSVFVARGATQVRAVTSAYASASWSVRTSLGLQAQVSGSEADLTGAPGTTTLGGSFAVVWRLGQITASAYYQAARVQIGDAEPSFQQAIRTVLSRPFEL